VRSVVELTHELSELMAVVAVDKVNLCRVYQDIDDVTFWRRPMKNDRELAQLYLDCDEVTFRLRATRTRIQQLKVEIAKRSMKTIFH